MRNLECYNLIVKKFLVVSVIVFVALLFYWICVRPSLIRQNCLKEIEDQAGEWRGWTSDEQKENNDYRVCLVRNGLAPESIIVNLQ